MTEPISEPVVTTCAGCGQSDTDPKHIVHVGVAEVFGTTTFHPKDVDQDGYIEYHFDCDDTNEFADQANPAVVAQAKSGVHGEALRTFIQSQEG